MASPKFSLVLIPWLPKSFWEYDFNFCCFTNYSLEITKNAIFDDCLHSVILRSKIDLQYLGPDFFRFYGHWIYPKLTKSWRSRIFLRIILLKIYILYSLSFLLASWLRGMRLFDQPLFNVMRRRKKAIFISFEEFIMWHLFTYNWSQLRLFPSLASPDGGEPV